MGRKRPHDRINFENDTGFFVHVHFTCISNIVGTSNTTIPLQDLHQFGIEVAGVETSREHRHQPADLRSDKEQQREKMSKCTCVHVYSGTSLKTPL